MNTSIGAERDEGGEDNEKSCPTVVEREWKVNEYFVRKGLRGVVLLDDVVDVCHTRGDQEGKYEG